MKNILSYAPGTEFLGSEINAWITHQIVARTGNMHEAIRLKWHYQGFAADGKYQLVRMQFQTRGPEQFGFLRVKE
jgi:hypothetical protein